MIILGVSFLICKHNYVKKEEHKQTNKQTKYD